ncbi:hypothetical protein F5876DRAFT_50597 [Lentinula aff. lateritia]|uniref:Uncharacterized protein n=1 Tax=Lentinula aff. lateritia TaxID=2804960 RepID=A0ACC1TNA0_9AGAR|nr:hypothetical protein F5876DRAFT_50597 [Lentinula aff. lateritia]
MAFSDGFVPSPAHFHAEHASAQQGVEWKKQRKHQYNIWRSSKKLGAKVQVHHVSERFDLAIDSRISKPAWMGLKPSKDMREAIHTAVVNNSPTVAHSLLEGIRKISYVAHLAVAVCDLSQRMFLYRSELTPNVLFNILPRVNVQVPEFVKDMVYPFTENDMLKNSRGDHWFSIAGHDRNNKKEPNSTVFQEANKLAIAKHFGLDKIFRILTYQASIKYMKTTFGIEAQFGLFFNACLNTPRKGVRRVFFLELPVVTTVNGEKPSKQNSNPLYFCGCDSHEGNQGWAEADGRGSMVWFNQASMFQTSETGFNNLKEAREAGADDKCDMLSWLDHRDLFPKKEFQ